MSYKTSVVLCLFGLVCFTYAEPCKQTDTACLNKNVHQVIQALVPGIPANGIEVSDPQFIDLVIADIAGLKYNFSEVDFKGYRTCEVKNVKLDLQRSNMKYNLICAFDVAGQYVMKGRLIVLPVEGDGVFTIKAKKMQYMVDSEVKVTDGSDGHKHMSIKKFTLDIEALENVVFDFQNLFNGNKVLSDGVHNFANSNSKEVMKEVSLPLFNHSFKKLIKNINKYLKSAPLEALLIL